VHALHIDPESAFLEYLSMYYKLGRAGRALDRFGVTEFATTIAPGVRDVLLTGKVYEAVGRRRSGRTEYDSVVLDAPPTGRVTRFLNVNADMAGLARGGPVRSQADSIMGLLRSDRTRVHVVTLLEEMPVQETADGISDLAAAGLPVGGVIVNQVRSRDIAAADLEAALAGRLDTARLAADLKEVGVDSTDGLVEGLVAEAHDHAVRRALEDSQREVVAGLGRPTYELPRLTGGVDLGGLYELAAALKHQGLA
jgi:anion-transporting  ArsA/GET3 family ATPase